MKTPHPLSLFTALALASTLSCITLPALAAGESSSILADITKGQFGNKGKFLLQPGIANTPSSPLSCANGYSYQPLEPFEVFTFTDRTTKDGVTSFEEVPWPTKTSELNTKLPNISTEIGSSTLTTKGSLWLLEGSKNDQSIVIDFIKYRSEMRSDVTGQSSTEPIYARIGVGMRIFINLKGSKVGFSGSLLSLPASISADHASGTISAQLIGIDSPDVTQAMPFTSDITPASVQRIIEAMAIVKSRLSDDHAVLRPQLLAKITCKPAAT